MKHIIRAVRFDRCINKETNPVSFEVSRRGLHVSGNSVACRFELEGSCTWSRVTKQSRFSHLIWHLPLSFQPTPDPRVHCPPKQITTIMRFGQDLHRRIIPEWSQHYVDYNLLKRLTKSFDLPGSIHGCLFLVPRHTLTLLQTSMSIWTRVFLLSTPSSSCASTGQRSPRQSYASRSAWAQSQRQFRT